MKKIYLVIIVLAICSCSVSYEDKVANAFRLYAEKNLDNPSALEEIVGIDSIDTLSSANLKKEMEQMKILYDSAKHRLETLENAFLKVVSDDSIGKISKRKNVAFYNEFESAYREWYNKLQYRLDFWGKQLNESDSIRSYDIEKEYKSIKSHPDTTFIKSILSYRVKQNGEIKLKRIMVLCDTLYNNIH